MNFNEFCSDLAVFRPDKLVFVGLGNPYRGDDAAGLIFLRNIQKKEPFRASHFIHAGTNPDNHLEQILAIKPRCVVFLDAARFGGEPGDIQWLDNNIIDGSNISTHAFSIKLVENYLKMQLSLTCKYLGIQPLTTALDIPLSSRLVAKIESFFAC